MGWKNVDFQYIFTILAAIASLTRINQRNSSSKTGDCAIIGSAVV
jgi:hypothetical protein